MDKYAQQAKELWSRWQALSAGRKSAYAAIGVIGVGFVFMVWWLAQPEYRVLYAGLSAEEAGAITSKLKSSGVSFKLASGGTTILVPADQAMQVHLDLSVEGIAGSSKISKGFELFDQPMLGATPFNQHVNFTRAQQAELARTIMQMDPIIFARVQIARPEPSPFIREQKPTTASVMVKLRPGATLNRSAASAIAVLVAGSVEGLAKENVKIVDTHLRVLSEKHDAESGIVGSMIEQRKEVEHYLAGEAERMLTHVLGPGRAIVRVTAELNTKQMREKKEIINADGKVAKTEKITINKTTSSGANKGGATGTSSNLGKPGGGSGASGSTSNQETQQSDYDYPRTFQEWHNKHGSIDRLTIAAFVDTSSATGKDAVIALADVQEIIKKAVGFKNDRDEIQVTQVSVPVVSSQSFEEAYAGHQQWQMILSIVRNASIGMVALCACVIAWVALRRFAVWAPAVATPQPDKLQRIKDELDRNPEMLAKVLTRWIDRSEPTGRVAA